jgi:hypothetical protein
MLIRDVLESNAKPPIRAKWLWTRVHGNILFVLSFEVRVSFIVLSRSPVSLLSVLDSCSRAPKQDVAEGRRKPKASLISRSKFLANNHCLKAMYATYTINSEG